MECYQKVRTFRAAAAGPGLLTQSKLEYSARSIVMMVARPGDPSLARAYSVGAKRPSFLCRCRAPRRGGPASSRHRGGAAAVAYCSQGSRNPDGGGGFSANRANRANGAVGAVRAFRAFGAFGAFEVPGDPPIPRSPDPSRSRHRLRRVPRAPPAYRTGPREAHRQRPRLPRAIRFPGGISARQRSGSSHGARARFLRDVFGHTASISRRRTS